VCGAFLKTTQKKSADTNTLNGVFTCEDILKADLLTLNSFEVDQKSVLIHPRFMSPERADIFVLVLRSNALSKPGIKVNFSSNSSHSSKHFSTVNFVGYVYCLLTFKKGRKN